MDILYSVFESAEDGDRILVKFPDAFSFHQLAQWMASNFGDPFWILWTDAAVERINHLTKKYGPLSGEALVIGSGKDCKLICVERLDVYSDISRALKSLPLDGKIVISFGVDFLESYGHPVSRFIDVMINQDRGVFVTAVFEDLPEKIKLFHDVVIEIKRSEESYFKYYSYLAKITYPLDSGIAEVGEVLKFG